MVETLLGFARLSESLAATFERMPNEPHDGMIIRQTGELKDGAGRAAAVRSPEAILDFVDLPKPRSAMRFEGDVPTPGVHSQQLSLDPNGDASVTLHAILALMPKHRITH